MNILQNENNFGNYLGLISQLKNHVVIIAVRDTIVPSPTRTNISDEEYRKLENLGLKLIRKDNIAEQFWSGYAAVISDGKVVYENLSARGEDVRYEGEEGGSRIQILSSPYKNQNAASIIVNGTECALNERGFNFVIIHAEDASIADRVSFDTWSAEKHGFRKEKQRSVSVNAATKQKDHYDVGIMGVWAGCNYGSIATYYALNRTIEKMGYSVLMIDKPRIMKEGDAEMQMTHSRIFANQHYNISKSYKVSELAELNKYCDTFVMGSDQVWNYGISKNFGKSYYLDFVLPGKKKVAYAASFGHGKDFAPPEEREIISGLMKDFDAISVRESDGVRICRDIYDVNATQVIDPVFLADREIFDELAKESHFKEKEPYVATYILDPTPEKVQLMQNVSQRLGCKLVNILDGLPWLFEQNKKKLGLEAVENVHVEDWISIISKCRFLITDSVHGTSIGLLYNRPFIALTNAHRGISRFASLSELFGIGDRILKNPTDGIDNDHLLEDIDYVKINNKLLSEKKRCHTWLKNALELKKGKLSSVILPDKAVRSSQIWKDIKCTGCGACANICPVDAISMQPNQEGFYNPEVDFDKCINCGKCAAKCVALHPQYLNSETPECYAFWASDEIRAVSSSGGVFSVAAEYILDNGGYVAGTVYNEDFSVRHTIVSDKSELWKMRGSKYMQSNVGEIYDEVKKLLEKGKTVLFTGLPCHVAALYSCLGNSKYENLYTIDLVCHGITSQKVFNKFHQDVLKGKKIVDLQFKAKQPWGWHAGTNAKFEDGTKYSEPLERCPYFIAYLKNISKNRTCGECMFNHLPRQADLSIGDFWGINKYNPKYNDKKGTSEILVNNEHGAYLLEKIKPEAKLLEPVPVSYALNGNPVMRHPYGMNKNREYFFQNLNKMDFAVLTNICFQNNFEMINEKALAELDTNLHGLYYLAKATMQNYKGRKIVTWGHGPKFNRILKKYFGLNVEFQVYLQKQYVNGTTAKSIDVLRGKSSEYFVISIAKKYDSQAQKIFTEYGFTQEKDYIFLSHKPILLENFDLSKGHYSDVYGNKIVGSSGVITKVIFRGLNSHIVLEESINIKAKMEFDMASNAAVKIGKNCSFLGNMRFQMIGNSTAEATVEIGNDCRFLDALIKLYGHEKNSLINIKDRCTFESELELHANSGKKIFIGQDCMFSHNVDVWAGDGHTVFDVNTKKNINSDFENLPAYKNEVIIGDHVWICKGAFILAGTNIETGSIVGARSVVKGSYPNNCVIAGNPAQISKRDIAWSRDMCATDIRKCGSEEYISLTKHGESDDIKKKRSVLILGGTGRMSSKLTSLCLKNGDDVTIAVRGRHKIDEKFSSVKKLVFDRLSETQTSKYLSGKYYDVVFDCSAMVPQCVDWVLGNIKTKRYIYVSSFETYALYRSGLNLKEDILPLSNTLYETEVKIGTRGWYARGKRSTELLIANKYSDINYAIVRIPFVMSLNDEDYEDDLSSRIYKYVSAIIFEKPIAEKNLEKKYSFVESTDEAAFLYFLANHKFKGVINFASQGCISIKDVIGYVEKKSGKKAILSPYAESYPFSNHPEVTMHLGKCLSLGYTPINLEDWIYKKIDKYIIYSNEQTILQSVSKIEKSKIQNWLITGGSSGFGKEFALRLNQLGYTVAATSRNIANLNDLPDEIIKIELDVRNLKSCKAAIDKAIGKMGKVDVLVNNAGILHASNFEETPLDVGENIIATNYWGVSNMLKVTIPHMRQERNGTIINISSIEGVCAANYSSYYVASKFAVDNLTKNLKFECQKFARFMAIEFGGFNTGITKRQYIHHTTIDEYKKLPPIHPFRKGYRNDIRKAVDSVIEVANNKKLPRNLVLGGDAIQQYQQALETLEKESEKYKSISITTDEAKKDSVIIKDITLPRNKKIKIQNWLITGASEGFGRVLALRLYELGYTVTVTSRDMSRLKTLPENIYKIESQLDSYDSCKDVISNAIKKMGSVDVLVNNATSNCWCSFEECPDDIMKKVFYVNFTLPGYMIKAVLPHFRKNHNGTVINITSIAGIQPRARVSTYSAAKAALEGLTRTLKSECQRFARFMAVELVCMRTRIMIHNPVFDSQIEDYKNLGRYTQSINNIPNRKDIAAQQIINVVNNEEVPQSLLIGTESYLIAKNEIQRARKEFEDYKEVSLSVSRHVNGV